MFILTFFLYSRSLSPLVVTFTLVLILIIWFIILIIKEGLNLKGAQLAGTGKLGLIAHSDPMAFNEPGKEPKVVIEDEEISPVSNSLTVPPMCAGVYTLPVK